MWIALTLVLALVYYYFWHVVHAPRLIFKAGSKRNLALQAALGEHLRVFKPLWYGFNTHVQTILNVTLRRSPALTYDRQIVPMRDGGQTAIDWTVGAAEGAPVCLLMTGYTGSSQELEIRILVKQLMDDGFQGET